MIKIKCERKNEMNSGLSSKKDVIVQNGLRKLFCSSHVKKIARKFSFPKSLSTLVEVQFYDDYITRDTHLIVEIKLRSVVNS